MTNSNCVRESMSNFASQSEFTCFEIYAYALSKGRLTLLWEGEDWAARI